MIRSPLRPLTKILKAREEGLNPDFIEAEEKVRRLRSKIIKEKFKATQRIYILIGFLLLSFSMVALKMTALASKVPDYLASSGYEKRFHGKRATITDRNGAVLATNITTHSVYVHPYELIEKKVLALKLSEIFTDLNSKKLEKSFNDGRKFVWIKKQVSPEQQQAIRDLGQPGIYFGSRETRLYPNGRFASHVLGGSTFGGIGVDSAELIGQAGIELSFDSYLKDPMNYDKPLSLSLDMSVQAIIEKVLEAGIKIMNAKGGSAVLMNVHNGQILSMTSLPDFDPNNRPPPPLVGDPADSPLFNRAAQGIYELGSTFKIFTVAQVLEQEIADVSTIIDIRGPIYLGKRFSISDHHYLGEELSVSDIIIKSSNIGTAKLAAMIGGRNQKLFLEKLGLLDQTTIELPEAKKAKPQRPENKKWSKSNTATISYGYGISVSPLHLAAAYSTIVNGGVRVFPTLLSDNSKLQRSRQVISVETSAKLQEMLKQVVENGTAKGAKITGYSVGGKTGTAEKVNFANGGYIKDKVITTFVATFPMEAPKYVLVVTLDEPEDRNMDKPIRTAGWTAVPVAREIISRIAPVLGIPPKMKGSDY